MNHRLPTLDGLRGIAVMGIVAMNVVGFALPSGAYFNPLGAGPATPADIWAWATAFVLVDGKMRALFSILFGAGLAILADRAEAEDRDPGPPHLRRMAALGAIGAAHYILLWPGDILLHYALVGAVALPIAGLEPRQQVRVAILLLVGEAAVEALVVAGDLQVRAAGGTAWTAMAAGIGAAPATAIEPQIALHRGGWLALVADHAREMAAGVPFTLVFNGLETLAYVAIGMAAQRTGFLAGNWSRSTYARTAALCLGLALPASALLAWGSARTGFETIATFAAATLAGIPLRPLAAIGYAAIALPWIGRPAALRKRIQAAGRMTLSNYLLTSLVLATLFEGWGLGLFARWDRLAVYAIVPLLWLAMLAWSAPWLARHRYGPAEWAWRCLAAGEWLALRRSKAIASI